MTERNRAEGWKHAKHSGHALEVALAMALQHDQGHSSELHRVCFGHSDASKPRVVAGGIGAGHVHCILGGVTQSKTDLSVCWPSGRTARLSLKKSSGGQVWLITLDRFLAGFSASYGASVPDNVKLGLRLFIGPLSADEMRERLKGELPQGPRRAKDGSFQELHQKRFVARTLSSIIPDAWAETLCWIQTELPRITEMCFSRGLCSDTESQAEFVWYYIIDESSGSLFNSQIVPVSSLVDAVARMAPHARAVIGPRNGGSTILVPFGFMQMHRPKGENQIQFHHSMTAITEVLGS